VAQLDNAGKPWDSKSLFYLESHWGYKSSEKIAVYLGRTEFAVHRQAKKRGLTYPVSRPCYLSISKVAKMLGISWVSVRKLIERDILPWINLYQRTSVRKVIHIEQLQVWIADPSNWVFLPQIEAVNDLRLKRIIKKASQEWGDEWISVNEAAALRHVSADLVYIYIYEGRIPAFQMDKGSSWKMLRSVVEKIPFGRDSVVAIFCRGCKRLFEISGTLYKKLVFGDDLVVAPVTVAVLCSFCGRKREGPFAARAQLVERCKETNG
jgi:hypothetical protein